jgi:glycosyltransferase involved in cell wall biosynthesis
MLANGHESYIAYGRGDRPSKSQLIRIGRQSDVYLHGLKTLLLDRHGFGSRRPTAQLIQEIERIQPDVIGLHNLHGYYLHIGVLFEYLKESGIPVLWTLFDCWAFTGHCSYFDDIQCEKWLTHCQQCPKSRNYPKAYVDNSFQNFEDKRRLFTGLKNLELIVHSNWLAGLVKQSFLKDYPVHVTPSAIDLDVFKSTRSDLRERYGFQDKKIILGCASIWSNRKGYYDFIALRQLLNSSYQIVMIGLKKKEIRQLPDGILGIQRTESIEELAQWYTLAHVFVNPTSQDNFPTTNLEALACGTPVVTYNTGGSPEAIDEETGFVVEKGDVKGIVRAVETLSSMNYEDLSSACRDRAKQLYDKKTRYLDYLDIFERMLNS